MTTSIGWRSGSAWRRANDRWNRPYGDHMPLLSNEAAIYPRRAKNRSGWHIVASLIAVAGFVMVVGILLGMNA